MDYLQKSYIRHFQPTADNLGMHRTRHTYVRVTNDLMQTFTLKRYRFGHECTIVFAIVPLCFGITHVDMERYNLRQFLVQRDIGEWRYDAQDEQNMDTCMMDILCVACENLIPLFTHANKSELALNDLIELEDRFERNRKACLQLNFIQDGATSHTERMILDDVKYYMALKCGNYKYARQAIEAKIQSTSKNLRSMDDLGYLTEKSRVIREQRIDSLKQTLQYLEQGDVAFFQTILDRNENLSKKTLHRFIKP